MHCISASILGLLLAEPLGLLYSGTDDFTRGGHTPLKKRATGFDFLGGEVVEGLWWWTPGRRRSTAWM